MLSSPLLAMIFALGAVTVDDAASPTWKVLTPEVMTSEGGATLSTVKDGSILVTGESPAKDVYELELFTDLRSLTALRLEALPDDSLKGKGPGRSSTGNFVLSILTLDAKSKFGKKWFPVKLKSPTASFSQTSWNVNGIADGKPKSGWAIKPEFGQRHVAVVETGRDIDHKTGTWLRVRMEFQYGNLHTLGRFRISTTDAKRPVRAAGSAQAQAWHEIQNKIGVAQSKGLDWMLEHQELDGSWAFDQGKYRTGMTGLAVYALLKSGIPKTHPSIKRGIAFLRSHDSHHTYSMSTHIIALVTFGDDADRERLKMMIEQLMSWQNKGGYAYPGGALDLSNTQYAALALRTAANAGFKVPQEIWNRLADYALLCKEEHRNPYAACGFSYHGKSGPSSSMTCAGIGVLAIVAEQMRRSRGDVKTGIQQGLQWLSDHWDVSRNVKPGSAEGEQHRYLGYFLYGLERVGGLLNISEIGDHDWYRDGAAFLTESQKEDGSWTAPRWDEKKPNTCYALLFLSRATGATTGVSTTALSKSYGADDPDAEFSVLASGDSPLAMWVTSYGTSTKESLVHEGEETPRVAKVDWLMAGDRDKDEPIRFASVPGDPGQSAGPKRFAAQHVFPRSGVFQLWAEMHVVASSSDPNDSATWVVLESKTLEVRINAAPDPMLVRYAGDASRNVLTKTRVLARASSVINDSWAASLAHDNLQSRGWLSKDDDATPSIVFDMERQVRADRILLTHAKTSDKARTGRAKRVKVEINRKHEYEFDMEPDDGRKTVCIFPKAVQVRRVMVQVLESTGATSDKRGVGFAEIELQLERKKKK